ncbi:MAG: MATE family efflux transporter, partial [Mesorhizobium sp.]
IALCILLGLELGWGVAGVAWATVTGEFVAMLLGLAIIGRRFWAAPRLPRHRILDLSAFLRMMSLNRDIMIRSFSLLAAFARATMQFRHAVRLTVFWGFGLAATATLVLLLGGTDLVALITTSQDVRAVADNYVAWAAFTALSGVLAFQMDGVFIGATWSRDMRNMMLFSFLVFSAALLILAPAFGNHGLWAALHVFLLVRGFSLLAILRVRMRAAF